MAVVPGDPDKLYAGYYGSAVGVSVDGGNTWALSAAGLPPESKVIRLEVDPTDEKIIYAGMIDTGVFVSMDGGATWTGLNDGLINRAVREMAISSDGSVLYMISERAGVFRLGAVPAKVYKLFLPISAK